MIRNRTSSLKMHAICDLCGKREKSKHYLAEHLKTCVANRTCNWCNIVFKNRGNLFSHTIHIHGNKTNKLANMKKVAPTSYTCSVCPKTYSQVTNLRYHIRRDHFNLIARIMENEDKKLNEVWLERVLNSDALVEIRKAKCNMYLMRKVAANDSLKISEPIDSIDLTSLYPTHVRKNRVWCDLCNKSCYKQDFQKHLNEKHEKITRHQCNNCHRTFKRPYLYLKHNCTKKMKKVWKRNEKRCVDNITIHD